MDQELKGKIITLVQNRINECHTSAPRSYTSKTPNGVVVQRIGLSVYVGSDKSIETIATALQTLSEEGIAGHPDPMLVDVDGDKFVIVGSQFASDENNYSDKPKVILADHMPGSNAEVTKEERQKKMRLLQEIRESSKNLKSTETAIKKELVEVSEEEFDELIS